MEMPQKFIFMMNWDQEVIRSEEIAQKGQSLDTESFEVGRAGHVHSVLF